MTKRVVAISIRSGVKAPEDSSELLNLKGLKIADLSCLDTSSTIRLASLFEGCSELLSVELGGIDTSKVQSVDHMFYACSSLTSLDLSSLEFRSVRVANALVSECYALADLRLPKTFGTELWGMDAMFAGDSRLSALDLSAVDMGAVAEALHVFRDVAGLVEWKVGKGFRPAVLDELPSSPDERGWWSVKDSRWYTNDQIKSQRSGMADTYRSKGEEKPVPEEKPQGQGSTPKNEGGQARRPEAFQPQAGLRQACRPQAPGQGRRAGQDSHKAQQAQ
ncbi:BspA family leucine-rich repeat surface protein [Olsenella phocaeensis]|uniref:BspA family leucine-rich repeat surface protein n=1 Tax=Olsenella phocaeensis TaxID=1852385 RepID=UPI0013566845|nr:BspA family leucine-rich repeat surface protein [Olsenella phocaeensis]